MFVDDSLMLCLLIVIIMRFFLFGPNCLCICFWKDLK